MANLNLIGNGFDLYHGLPSDYYYFACYMLSKNEALYDDLADMYGFSRGIYHPISEDLERRIDDDRYWKNFEYRLGKLNSSWAENHLLDNLGLENPDAVELDMDLPNHSGAIKKMLSNWVRDTLDKDINYQIIKDNIKDSLLILKKSDTYISFNYTHTLEELYNIDSVLHIHGECMPYSDYEELIIGHGNNCEIHELEERIAALEPFDFEQATSNRRQECRFELKILNDLRKPVEICQNGMGQYLNRMDRPEAVFLYGLSLSDVDKPYLEYIRRKWPGAHWNFSWFNPDTQNKIHNVAHTLGLSPSQYDLVNFNNPYFRHIKDLIIEANHLELVPKLKS